MSIASLNQASTITLSGPHLNNKAPLGIIREFKQSTTAGATTAAVTEKVWGEYVSVVC